MALNEQSQKPVRVLFHNSYPGLNGSQKIALQLLKGLPPERYEAWAGGPFATEFLDACELPPGRRLDFGLPASFRTFRGGLLRRNPLQLCGQILTQLLPFWLRTKRRLVAEGIDFVYVSNERCLFFVGIPARLAGKPVLWHLQSGFRRGRPWLHRWASRLATRAIAVSEAVREDARGFVRPGLFREMRMIYNGLPEAPPASVSPGTEHFRLTFIGALTPEKGLHLLLEAAGQLSENLQNRLIINVAGVFPEDWYREIIAAQIAALPVGVKINLLGYCPNVQALLAQTDLLVVPSVEIFTLPSGQAIYWKEGFNLVALEGLRAGVPVLAAATYGLREVIHDGEAGLGFRPGDAADLREKIERLAASETLSAQLGRQGRARYEQLFTAEKMQAQFLEVLTEMTAGRG